MKNFTLYTAVLLCLFVSKTFAQDTFEEKVKIISAKIENVTKQEKEALKKEVEAVNVDLENGIISAAEAEQRKKNLAQKRAGNIETKVAQYEDELKEVIQLKVNGKLPANNFKRDTIVVGGKKYPVIFDVIDNVEIIPAKRKYSISIGGYEVDKKKRDSIMRNRSELRTTSQFVFAAGVNNLVTNGSIANSDFGYLRSVFFEWGITQETRIFKNNNLLHFKYGITGVYNHLAATDNRYFVKNGNQTILETYPVNLRDKDSYFKNVFITIPLHLEFDFTKKSTNDAGNTIFKTHESFRFGIGGFVGYNTNSKQFLVYRSNGNEIKERQKGNWNINDWNYGLSAYIGYKSKSLYLKYDLNPMFKNNAVDQNNISLGIRFDFN